MNALERVRRALVRIVARHTQKRRPIVLDLIPCLAHDNHVIARIVVTIVAAVISGAVDSSFSRDVCVRIRFDIWSQLQMLAHVHTPT